jgi:hypothetical protein
MAASPFDRNPLLGVLVLLLGAALYTVLLLEVVGAGAALPMPHFMQWIDAKHLRFWVWEQILNTLIVVLTGLPFAWALARLYAGRLLPAALIVVAPTVLWMGLDYMAMNSEIPDAPVAMNVFYAIDALKVLLLVPLMSVLLRARAAAPGRRP